MVIRRNTPIIRRDTGISSPVVWCLPINPPAGTSDCIFLRHFSSPLNTPLSLAFVTETSEALRYSRSSDSVNWHMTRL
ncbi:hypothetical protein Hanom_Chr09g00782781 [Helianthus anomalus]